LDDLHGASVSAPALVFLAQTIKDFGSVESAVHLYERAHKYAEPPQRAHIALNLEHTLEVCYRYQDAFDVIKSYLKENTHKTVVSRVERCERAHAGEARVGRIRDFVGC
jgi:hypothetical protein